MTIQRPPYPSYMDNSNQAALGGLSQMEKFEPSPLLRVGTTITSSTSTTSQQPALHARLEALRQSLSKSKRDSSHQVDSPVPDRQGSPNSLAGSSFYSNNNNISVQVRNQLDQIAYGSHSSHFNRNQPTFYSEQFYPLNSYRVASEQQAPLLQPISKYQQFQFGKLRTDTIEQPVSYAPLQSHRQSYQQPLVYP